MPPTGHPDCRLENVVAATGAGSIGLCFCVLFVLTFALNLWSFWRSRHELFGGAEVLNPLEPDLAAPDVRARTWAELRRREMALSRSMLDFMFGVGALVSALWILAASHFAVSANTFSFFRGVFIVVLMYLQLVVALLTLGWAGKGLWGARSVIAAYAPLRRTVGYTAVPSAVMFSLLLAFGVAHVESEFTSYVVSATLGLLLGWTAVRAQVHAVARLVRLPACLS